MITFFKFGSFYLDHLLNPPILTILFPFLSFFLPSFLPSCLPSFLSFFLSFFLSPFNKFIYFIYLIFGCIGSLLLCAGFLQLRRVGATLRCSAWASHCGGFSCYGAWALGTRALVVVALGLSSCGSQALEHRLSSCGAWAQLLRGMWDLPGPGIEPVSPTLAGGILTTAPPGKPFFFIF